MPRTARVAPGGCVYHVLNRAAARLPLFRKEADYAALERVVLYAHERRRPFHGWMAYLVVNWVTENTPRNFGFRLHRDRSFG